MLQKVSDILHISWTNLHFYSEHILSLAKGDGFTRKLCIKHLPIFKVKLMTA